MEKILFVDDEDKILAAFRRQLRHAFTMEVATSGSEGLEVLAEKGPFAVVVADLRMPGMDGITFLKRAHELYPDTVRVMLTGHADLSTAIDAINTGQIFRFLTKPCAVEEVKNTVQDALRQHQLIVAERELLEQTLNRSVNLLMEMLSLANPDAFSRTVSVRKVVHAMVSKVKPANAWQYELAAMLSQIGCIVLAPALLEKVNTGAALTAEEQAQFNAHPLFGYRLIKDIPRLEDVAQIVRDQLQDAQEASLPQPGRKKPSVLLGAQILHLALDYEHLIRKGLTHAQALAHLRQAPQRYNLALLPALDDESILKDQWYYKLLGVDDLSVGMVLDDEIHSRDGEVLGARYQEVTPLMLDRLQEVSKDQKLIEPFRVLIPFKGQILAAD